MQIRKLQGSKFQVGAVHLGLVCLVGICSTAGRCAADPSHDLNRMALAGVSQMSDQQTKELARLRLSGIAVDRTQIPELIQELKTPIHHEALKASLHSLAQMGAVKALPEINALCLDKADAQAQAYAQVAKARLLAEYSAQAVTSPRAEASLKIATFYQVLGMTPGHLNAVAAMSKAGAPQEQPLEVYAIREIADMVYRGNSSDYTSLLGVSQIDFHADYPAALKMRLAAVEPAQRLSVMLQELAHQDKWKEGDNYEIQLAADEEPRVGQAVADQLALMKADRSSYPEYGFEALFQVLECVGDKKQEKLLATFLGDKDGGVAQSAQSAYYYTVWGLQRQRAIGY